MHTLINDMLAASKKKDETTSAEKMKKFAERLLEADKFLIDQLYYVQLASIEGWKLANQVKFNKDGKILGREGGKKEKGSNERVFCRSQ